MLKLINIIFLFIVGLSYYKKSPDDFIQIAVIPKGTSHEFWKSVHAGAIKAEKTLLKEGTKVRIFWKGPLREDDREQQIQVVENFISREVDGIVLAPLDDNALVWPVISAMAKNEPTALSKNEDIIMQNLLSRGDLEYWCKVWEKLNTLFAQAKKKNLEPKQVLIITFDTLQNAMTL